MATVSRLTVVTDPELSGPVRGGRARGNSRQFDDFDDFVAAVAAELLRTASLITWDRAAAEDLVQEALFKVARRWPRVRGMEHPVAYARKIVVNLALDASKRHRRHRSELGPADYVGETPDHAAARAFATIDTASDLTTALASLPPRQRAVLALRYFDDLTEAETAKVLGCTVGTVKSTTSRALERLRTSPGLRDPGSESGPINEIDTKGVRDHERAAGE